MVSNILHVYPLGFFFLYYFLWLLKLCDNNVFNVHADFSCKVTELALKIVGVLFTAPPHEIEYVALNFHESLEEKME